MRRRTALAPQTSDDADRDELHQELNVHVKERAEEAAAMGKAPKPGALSMSGGEQLKDALKRPLTGLFRRPASRAGPAATAAALQAIGAQPPPPPASVGGGPKQPLPTPHARLEHTGTKISLGTALEAGALLVDGPNSTIQNGAPAAGKRTAAVPGSRKMEDMSASMSVEEMMQMDELTTHYPRLAKIDEIDISTLARYLCTEQQVDDEPAAWTTGYLLTSIGNDLRDDWKTVLADDKMDEMSSFLMDKPSLGGIPPSRADALESSGLKSTAATAANQATEILKL